MTKVHVVTGLGYGDEGKGGVVDHLARQLPTGQTLVVRHNGGPQAGHNVVTADGRHHCFSQFGSASLAGGTTFLSRFMLINPLNMFPEADHLHDLGDNTIWNRIVVDDNARLVTPWHVAINRLQELARGDGRHGSCGQGVGAAMRQDVLRPDLTLRVKDIPAAGFQARAEELRRYLERTHQDLSSNSAHWSMIDDPDVSEHLKDRFRDWFMLVGNAPSDHLKTLINDHEQVIFEGAQGVLLDQDYGFFPYVTWSNTTDENALALLREAVPTGRRSDYKPVRLGVIRAVTTRHGHGPHPTEDPELTADWAEPHNVTDSWQGTFRVGHLDLVAHRYAVTVNGGIDAIAVSHLDRGGPVWRYAQHYMEMEKIPLGRRGNLIMQEQIAEKLQTVHPAYVETDEAGLLAAIERNLGAPVTIASYGPTADGKRQLVAEGSSVK